MNANNFFESPVRQPDRLYDLQSDFGLGTFQGNYITGIDSAYYQYLLTNVSPTELCLLQFDKEGNFIGLETRLISNQETATARENWFTELEIVPKLIQIRYLYLSTPIRFGIFDFPRYFEDLQTDDPVIQKWIEQKRYELQIDGATHWIGINGKRYD